MSNKEPLNGVDNNNLDEDELWYKTIQEDTITSYRNYVMIFPEGKKVEKALSLIRHYELLNKRKISEEAASKNTVSQKSSTSILPRKNSTKSSGKTPGKIKLYPVILSILSVLIITAGLAMWIRSGSSTGQAYAGVDSIIISTTKPYNPATETETDSLKVSGLVNDQQSASGNNASSGSEENKETREKVNDNADIAKPLEKEKKTDNIQDTNVNAELLPAPIEPVVVKDSISAKEEVKGPFKIPHGVKISVILDEPLSSEEVSKDGSPIKLHCSENVELDGKTVIAKGATVTGKIVDVVPSTGRKRALIGFVIEKVTATNGTVINLDSQRYHKSASEAGKPVGYSEGLLFYAKLKRH